jgi:tRNA modification GTPase
VVRELFQPATGRALPEEAEEGRFWLGRFGEMGRDGADEVVLAVKCGPAPADRSSSRSVPGPWLELHCHGGREVVRLLQEVMAARGVVICSWQELESDTAKSPWRAEALAALVRAPTARTAAILFDQYQGALVLAVRRTLQAVRNGDLAKAGELLGALAAHGTLGLHLTEPWRVVIAGAPNVGKSSLVNALVGFQRSVVAQAPGTTRDVVTARIAVDGWPVELADTAGWRDGAEALERQGIDLARTAAARADLCLWVLDATTAPVWPGTGLERVRFIVNKIDLPAVWDLECAADAVRVSARTGAGLAELCQVISGWLVPRPPGGGTAIPFTPALCGTVDEAQRLWGLGQIGGLVAVLERGLDQLCFLSPLFGLH